MPRHYEDILTESEEAQSIRRRRECLKCERRFTTYERIDEIPYMIVKKDGRREKLDRGKVQAGLLRACEKRPVSMSQIEEINIVHQGGNYGWMKREGTFNNARPLGGSLDHLYPLPQEILDGKVKDGFIYPVAMYDHDEGRAITAALTAIMTGVCYATSAEMAKELGPFPRHKPNAQHMLRVIRNHRRAAHGEAAGYEKLAVLPVPLDIGNLKDKRLAEAAARAWDKALALGEQAARLVAGADQPDAAGQQHHGQHLLSAAIERLTGAATLSFHLGVETCTVDLDRPPAALSPETLAAVEAEANRLVRGFYREPFTVPEV